MPEGTKNDPFLYSGYGQFDYLKIATANGANFDGKFMIMSNEEAKEISQITEKFGGQVVLLN